MDFKLQRPAVSADLQPPLSNTFPTTTTENSESERHVPTKSSSKLTSSESDKLSVLPGVPTHTTGTVTSPKTSTQRPTNLGLATTQTKRGYRRSLDAFTGGTSFPSFSSNNLNFDSHTPLNHLVWDGGLNAGMNSLPFPRTRVGSASDADGGGTRTPKKRERVSFDGTSDSGSLPTMRSVGQAFSRLQERGSDPIPSSPAIRTSAFTSERLYPQRGRARHPGADSKSPNMDINLNSRSSSPSHSHTRSRAASPLRIFQQWSAGLHRDHTTHHGRPAEERFVPVNPFKRRTHLSWSWCCFSSSSPPDLENGAIPAGPGTPSSNSSSNGPYNCDDLINITSIKSFGEAARVFLSDTLPRQVYLNFLLRLPAMYFSRVARVFEDAEVSRPDIERMIESIQVGVQGVPVNDEPVSGAVPFRGSGEQVSLAGMDPRVYPPDQGAGVSANGLGYPQANVTTLPPLPFPEDWTPPLVSPSLIRFKHSWEAFIDSLLREWKTLNVVSALLASAILTIFQIPEAANDPITRSAALLSLICALMSLSYGCMYIVRFGTMRSMYRASRWAEEARRTNTVIWWNVWVLLAMPAVWMSWSMLFFLASILSFVWRTGSEDDPSSRAPLSTTAVLGPRVAITGVLVLGLVYLAMIVKTLMRYGRGWGGIREGAGRVDPVSGQGEERAGGEVEG